MSLFEHVARLPLRVEGVGLEPRALESASGWVRLSTVVRLEGGGVSGRGEDTTYSRRDQERLRAAGPPPSLAGTYTLASFSELLDGLELWPEEPELPAYRDYRRWAIESAALELALAQTRITLAEALGRERRPARYVVSMGLGTPPTTARLHELLALEPRLAFKLDTSNEWDERLVAELAELGRVEVVDFKGAYSGTPVDQVPDPALYRRVLEGLSDAWLEDPHRVPEVDRLLEGRWDRVTWDAPIHSAADVAALEHRPRMLNVKPSRCGTLRRLLELYEHCEANGIGMYGGGQFELAEGRRTIQELAGIFHPDAPNDVAPTAFHHERVEGPIEAEGLTLPGAGASGRARPSSRAARP